MVFKYAVYDRGVNQGFGSGTFFPRGSGSQIRLKTLIQTEPVVDLDEIRTIKG